MMFIAQLIGIAFVVAVLVAYVTIASRDDEGRREAWQRFAARRGGEFRAGPRRFMSFVSQDEVEVRCAHASVRLSVHVTGSGKSERVFTRACAHFVIGGGPRFKVTPAGLVASVGRALGGQDVELGNRRFDREFIVKGEDDAGIRCAWRNEIQEEMTRALSEATVVSRGSEIVLLMDGGRLDGLDAIVDVVGALASVGADALDGLAACPDATLNPAAGTREQPTSPSLKLTTTEGDATAMVAWHEGGPRVRLVLPLSGELPAFQAEIHSGHAAGFPHGLLSEYAVRLLDELPGALVASTARALVLLWPGIPDVASFTSGAHLLADVASAVHRTSAFR